MGEPPQSQDLDRCGPPFSTTFECGRKKIRLEFDGGNEIKWGKSKSSEVRQSLLPIKDVLAVHHDTTADQNPNQFTIHYAERKRNIWRHRSLTFTHSDDEQIVAWVGALRDRLRVKFSHRPKQLLLFVNPYGGKRRGMKIFEKYGKPLFDVAGVEVSVIVSQRANQIRDILVRHNLDVFDAVGCVGGDGTVSEVVNGLVLRECRLRGINPDDPQRELPRPTIPVGIIPGGSTDTTAYCLYGTTDVTTAVMQIIFGDTVGLDLVSVHDGDRFLRLYADVVSYGYLGDIAYYSERLRWMGPTRYEYTGFKKLMANEGYPGQISIMTGQSNATDSKCYENCAECSSKRDEQPPPETKTQTSVEDETSWKTIDGKFFMVSGANITCAGERNPNGLAPYCHLGDGYLHLLVIYHTSVFNSLMTLHRFTRPDYTIDNLSHVEVYRTKQFRFRAGDTRSRWNCDGEVVHHTDIRARVHCQLLKVFTRGISRPSDDKRKSTRSAEESS